MQVQVKNNLEIFPLTKLNCDRFGKQISDLHFETLNKKISPDYWQWRYCSDAGAKGSLLIGLRNNKVVGTYGLLHIPLIFKQQKRFAGLMGNFVISAKEKSWQCYKQLIVESMKQSKGDDLLFRIGLAPKQKVDLATRMGVKSLGYMPNCYGILDFKQALAARGFFLQGSKFAHMISNFFAVPYKRQNDLNITIKQIDDFNEQFDAFYQEYRDRFDTILLKDSKFLNWRYVKCPQNKYYKLAAYKDNSLKGYIVFCQGSKPQSGCLVELMAADNNKKIMIQLVLRACSLLHENKVATVSASFAQGSEQSEALRKAGFRKWFKRLNDTNILLGANTTEHSYSEQDFNSFVFGLGDWMEF
jgi:hypothetical protein